MLPHPHPHLQPYPVKFHDSYSSSDQLINFATFGSSGSVFASGGDDCKVSVWRVGKSHQPLTQLAGHSTPVDSIAFDGGEEFVAAGSRGGSIKLWEMAASGSAVRSLLGHRAAIRSLDFHPYGDFFASGSLDTNIKIWDIRKKHCIQTYRGHATGVQAIKHSPDGRWIISGDSTGAVKVWDLTAGKLLKDLESPHPQTRNSPIGAINFHPSEFVAALTSGSLIEWWDLENFHLISSNRTAANEPAAEPIKSIAFTRSGDSLISCSSQSVSSLSWEPFRELGRISTSHVPEYSGLCDLIQSPAPEQEFLTLSRNKNVLTLHFIPIEQFKNAQFASADEETIAAKREAAAATQEADKKIKANNIQQSQPTSSPAEMNPPASIPVNPRSLVPNAAFFSSHQPGQSIFLNQKAFQPPPSRYESNSTVTSNNSASNQFNSSLIPSPFDAPIGISAAQFQHNATSTLQLSATARDPIASQIAAIRASIQGEHSNMRDHLRDRLTSIRVVASEWQSASASATESASASASTSSVIKSCFQSLIRLKTLSASFDFLIGAEGQLTRSGNLTFESALLMIPILTQLIGSPFESYVKCGLRFLRFILWSFSPLIEQAQQQQRTGGEFSGQPTSIAVDIQRDERQKRAAECLKLLDSLNDKQIQKISMKNSDIGTIAKEVGGQINKLRN